MGVDAARRGYGFSNAGLVAGDGASLLVDTLFDLALTREMLAAMKPVTERAPITDALITHSNGDHTHGTQLLDRSVRIIAAKGTSEEIEHGPAPEMLARIKPPTWAPLRRGICVIASVTLTSAASSCATPT